MEKRARDRSRKAPKEAAAEVECIPPGGEKLTPEKGRAGRMPTYSPDMCARVVAFGSEGMSRVEIAFELGVSRTALYLWIDKHKEFGEAMRLAHNAAQAWWEKQGREGINLGKDFNATAFIFQVKNRFRNAAGGDDTYRDRHEVQHGVNEDFRKYLEAAHAGKFRRGKVDKTEDDKL